MRTDRSAEHLNPLRNEEGDPPTQPSDGRALSLTVKILWTTGFLIGATTHTLDLINFGWLPYEFRPLPWNVYWTSLTFLDPLAAILIWLRVRWAIILGTAIMASNVVVNGYTMLIGFEEFLIPWLLQSAFALFVFSVAWRHWAIRHSNVEAQ